MGPRGTLGPAKSTMLQILPQPGQNALPNACAGARSVFFDETASFLRNFDFFGFLGVFGVFDVFFSGTPEWVKFAVFSILPDPGGPGDPKVGSYSDRVVSWNTV